MAGAFSTPKTWPPTSAATSAAGRTFDTGIPGFNDLSSIASGNIKDLLTGAPSLALNRNAGATFAAAHGLAPASGTGDFMDRWNYDLYGQQATARKEQGLSDLLNMLQGYSGTAVARPGDILGQETSQRGQDIQKAIADSQLGQRQYEFGQTFPESQRQFNTNTDLQRMQMAQQGAQFNADYALRQLLGIGGLGTNMLNSYLNFLS